MEEVEEAVARMPNRMIRRKMETYCFLFLRIEFSVCLAFVVTCSVYSNNVKILIAGRVIVDGVFDDVDFVSIQSSSPLDSSSLLNFFRLHLRQYCVFLQG